jgi:penicillin amidase
MISLVLMFFSGCSFLNDYETKGTLNLPGLSGPVTVLRDEKGMAYIYAGSAEDAIMAQGFITAQDRLFQMELTRLFACGRISELAGAQGRAHDIRMRTIGFWRHGRRHAEILDTRTKHFFQKYLDGVNAFVNLQPGDHHLEFRLAGIKPGLWTLADSLAILYYMSWNSAANLDTEIITQALVDRVGMEKAKEILPLSVNPDEIDNQRKAASFGPQESEPLRTAMDQSLLGYLKDGPLRLGSNNWSMGAGRSAGKKPVVANDPHLDSRILPGPWYPSGLITPDFRAVGVTIPGIPGMVVGRTAHIALGVTNAYGDTQDLYVESLDPKDPERYLEGEKSLPFGIIEETLKIKDKNAPEGFKEEKVRIRLTGRGPVISGVLPDLKTDKVITLRYAPFEHMEPAVGMERLLTAKNTSDVREAVRRLNTIMLNMVFADSEGNIGWHVSGKLPIRKKGDGTIPFRVSDGENDWAGFVPFEEMPHADNPARGWVGTCNHMTVGKDYPHHYWSGVSPSFRYARLKELLDAPGLKTADDHWQFQRDTVNPLAREIAPLMAKALLARGETNVMGEILRDWDHRDDPDKAAPTVFQAVYRQFARLVFEDELGEETAKLMLSEWSYWHERLQRMVVEGRSSWFDDVRTGGIKESASDLFHRAALRAMEELAPTLGKDPKEWLWGKAHRVEYVSPIRRKGFGKGLVGGGSHGAAGSGETLHRNIYDFDQPFQVVVSASLRMVADLSDDDKILAVLPGGVAGRVFHPHGTDQIEKFMGGEKVYWWFSDKAIKEHTRSILTLVP